MAFETMTEMPNRPWGARLLSLSLEGFAVLAGVLMAFAVDSYGQTRDARERESRMLTALESELATNAVRLDSLIAAADQSIDEIDSIFVAVIFPPAGSRAHRGRRHGGDLRERATRQHAVSDGSAR